MSIAAPAAEREPKAPAAHVVRYTPYGGARELFLTRDTLVGMDGPAGTGKTRSSLEKDHLKLLKYPGARLFVARKSLVTLKASTLVTYREKVAKAEIDSGAVRFWAAKGDEPAHYAYANGSKYIPIGLDKPGKAMSTEYDGGTVDEATDTTLNDIEMLKTRMRNGVVPYQQMTLCFNPQGPKHWIHQQMGDGVIKRILSRHEDNPRYFDRATGEVTAEGAAYLKILDSLTGVRYARLRLGEWVAAEGTVYEDYWDSARNLIDRSVISSRPDDLYGDCGIPRDWPRYMGFDFGFNHPFVATWYAEDPDGRLYAYREIYKTNTLVEDHCKTIQRYSKWGQEHGDPLPRALICDHDAEGRATLERHLGIFTTAADKRVLEGIQAVQSRLLPAGDGKPRLFELKGALVERDEQLEQKLLPLCTVDEYDMYLWHRGQGTIVKDEVVKDYDHGLDNRRYMVAYKDLGASDGYEYDNPWGES